MNAAGRTLRLLAATLPSPVRNRYREEWLADLDGARELGMRPVAILAGALSTVVRIDRTAPSVSGMSVPALAARRARWGVAVLGASGLVAVALWTTGASLAFDDRFATGLAEVQRPAVVVAAMGIAVGLLLLATALAMIVPGPRGLGVVLAVLALPIGVLALGMVALSGMMLFFFAASGAGVIAVALVALANPHARGDRRRSGWVAVAFAVALLAIAATGILHVAVWNPLAKVPGLTLDEIYAGLAAAAETPSPVILTAWAAGAIASALAILIAASPIRRLRDRFSTRRVLVVGLLAVTGSAFSVWLAGFSHGMSIADAFMTSGGDAVGTASVLTVIGVAAGIPGMILAVAPGPRPTAPST